MGKFFANDAKGMKVTNTLGCNISDQVHNYYIKSIIASMKAFFVRSLVIRSLVIRSLYKITASAPQSAIMQWSNHQGEHYMLLL